MTLHETVSCLFHLLNLFTKSHCQDMIAGYPFRYSRVNVFAAWMSHLMKRKPTLQLVSLATISFKFVIVAIVLKLYNSFSKSNQQITQEIKYLQL